MATTMNSFNTIKAMQSSILLADRDPAITDAVRQLLEVRGFVIRTCNNGLQCMQILNEFAPTVLVLDHELLWGGSDGVIEWLITDEPFLPPMVVVASDHNSGPIPDRLEPWVDVQIPRPESVEQILPFVNQLETLAWWSKSPRPETSKPGDRKNTASNHQGS